MEWLQKKMGWFLLGFMIILSVPSHAQLCTGSLGDAIVNIDFGAGTGRGPALGSAVTAYTYSGSGQVSEAEYTIANSTSGLKGSAWHITTDHTGNGNGYMMVINSATLASEGVFYTKQITGLCPNTTYEFSAWIINVMNFNSPDPNVTFRVTTTAGTVLGSYNTGDLAVTSSPTWLQYGFFFNTGTESSVVVKILNSAPSAMPGNDLAIDDITFRPCGPNVVASVNGGTTAFICSGVSNSINLHGLVTMGDSNPSYQWQINTGSNWVDIPGATSLDYTYILAQDVNSVNVIFRLAAAQGINISSTLCRVLSNVVNLAIEPAPVASYSINSLVCVNQPTQFVSHSTGSSALSYDWNYGDGSEAIGGEASAHTYFQTGIFQTGLVVTSANGCIDTADNVLSVEVFDIPQAAFTAWPVDTTIFEPNVTITDASSGNILCSIDWGDGIITDCSDDTHTYAKYGEYLIMQVVENESGCRDSVFFKINKRPEFRIFIPNAFTPDGDGLNEGFIPGGMGWINYRMLIYNRWGQKVFETNDADKFWNGEFNGKPVQGGLYVYYITFQDAVEEKWYTFRGSVTLVK